MKNYTYILTLGLFLLSTVGYSETRADRVKKAVAANPKVKWYDVVDYGPFHSDTFRYFEREGELAVLKGIAIRVGDKEDHTVVFDSETMRMVAGFKGNITLRGTPFDGKHQYNSHFPKERKDYFFIGNWGPGWAIEGDWSDPREKDNDRYNGPLPDRHAEFVGIYRHAGGSLLKYTVDEVNVLELPSYKDGVIYRTINLAETKRELQLLLTDPIEGGRSINYQLLGDTDGLEIRKLESGRRVVHIPSGDARQFQIAYVPKGKTPIADPTDLQTMTVAGPALFPETIEVKGQVDKTDKPYAVDSIPLPNKNPWQSRMRFGAFDFFADGKRLACSTWNGDVWIAEGIDDLKTITWRRYATGLFQSLGLKIVDGVIYTMGRDQITRLHDLNDDGEADFYECFNNDVNITEGFHEFAFDLQTDAEGNFYFSKGQPVEAGGRGFSPWTEHGGTIMKVSADGSKLERVAWGLRAPGGLGLGPNGELTTGENEGSYLPRCKITWSKRPDLGRDEEMSFHGVVPSVWKDKKFVKTLPDTPTDYERPLCWLPYYVDNSSGSQFWVPKDSDWKLHAGKMLHLSYGKSSIYRTLIDEVDGQVQGGVYRLPIELTTASMRGRFHPANGHLYIAGFRGWQTNGGSGIQRVRYNGTTSPVPTGLRAHENGVIIDFSVALDPKVASDPRRYSIAKWDYVWGPQYGSGRFSIDNFDAAAREKALSEPSKGSQNQIDSVPVRAASLINGGKSVFLYVEKMTPAMQMEIKMDLADAGGKEFRETIWNTIHNLRDEFQDHQLDLTNLPVLDTEPTGKPGLILSMAADSTDDAVVVDRLAITVGEGLPATPFIDARKCREMTFEGNIAIKSRDKIAFHLEGLGWASLRIDGKTVAEGELPVSSDPIELEPGAHSIFCNFRRNDTEINNRITGAAGRIRLLWSGENFIKEPVPPKAYRHLPSALVESKDKTRHGRELFAAASCIRCHKETKKRLKPETAMPELLESLPDFNNIGNRLHQGWIEQWVRKPEDHCPSVAPDDAADIAAALAKRQKDGLKHQLGSAEKGKALVKSLHLAPWMQALTGRAKYTPEGLIDFLLDPAKHHAHTTFPDLNLEQEEAADLAAHIISQQPEITNATGGDAKRGEEVLENRCMVCHSNDVETKYEFEASLLDTMWNADWMVNGCLSEEEGNAPELGLSLEQKQALLAFRNVDSNQGFNSLNRLVPHEYAHRTMERLQCAECHSGKNKLPNIDLAGEKLRDQWLTGLFKGEVLSIRPYQKARMPAFASRAEALANGIAYRAGCETGVEISKVDKTVAETGEKIAGVTGYACNACHAAGEKPAMAAFEGQGPNLQLAGERLREDYYQAWMHWPQRFDPITIMPKYTVDKHKAVNPTFYDGDASKQWQAVWEWMKLLEGADKAPVSESGH